MPNMCMAKTITYFISGHRDISKENFEKYYVPAIEEVLNGDLGYNFVVGDCDGVDYMAQEYLLSKGVGFGVYHMYDKPRHFVLEGKSEREIELSGVYLIGGFKSDVERDSAMTKNSDIDIAFIEKGRWKSGTAQNILRRHEIIY